MLAPKFMLNPYWVMMGIILILTPVTCWVFTLGKKEERTPLNKIGKLIHANRYYFHLLGYVAIIQWKAVTDYLNEPIKIDTGHWTDAVYSIEGDLTLWIQQAFENEFLTTILNFHYLFIYLFLIYITTVYYAYVGERDLTDKVTLNYLLIYAVAVPYYLFFNVEVTSSWIPGMKALLYHDGWYAGFYASHDPLDNAVPSLHIAIPFGILLLNWLHFHAKGQRVRDWKHWPYHLFIVANTVLFAFTILYLGIHWFIDIPLGMAIGAIGALFIHHIHPRLRNDHGKMFRGVTRKKVFRHVLIEGIVALILLSLILGMINVQKASIDERVSFQLGPGDSTFEIIQPLDHNQGFSSEIFNLDEESNLEIIVIQLEGSISAMQGGEINWTNLSESAGGATTIAPGDSVTVELEDSMVWHFIVMHNPQTDDGGILKVKILNDYNQDLMVFAILLALPSLWMTSFVIHRLVRLKANNMSLIDSQPSHSWNNGKEAE
jgi:hypothetical protein